MELQEQTNSYVRDKRIVQAKISNLKREAQINKLTATNVESLAPETKYVPSSPNPNLLHYCCGEAGYCRYDVDEINFFL